MGAGSHCFVVFDVLARTSHFDTELILFTSIGRRLHHPSTAIFYSSGSKISWLLPEKISVS